jgi:hypothetical protein
LPFFGHFSHFWVKITYPGAAFFENHQKMTNFFGVPGYLILGPPPILLKNCHGDRQILSAK